MQSFDASCFAGNQLCGLPVTKNCSGSNPTGVSVVKEESGEVDYWLYIFMGLGYILGFWGVCFALILKKSWRHAFFLFVDEVWHKIYNFVV